MKKALLSLFIGLTSLITIAQPAKDYAVLVTATVQASPPKITLNWPAASANSFIMYRKSKDESSFGANIGVLAGSATSYEDTAVVVGEEYEYKIIQTMGSYSAHGTILSGIEVEPVEHRGKLVLLVDSTHTSALSNELATLKKDIEMDGWVVIRHDISPNETAFNVREIIKTDYNADPEQVKAVFIVGNVPVPYSGDINPDAHNNHKGAWPCDPYYGEMDGTWTDNSVNNTSSSQSRNHNIPGDGKWDQSIIPSNVELQVGRVDFNNMPKFSESEEELLRRYLNKNHAFKTKGFTAKPRALVDDNFGGFSGEAFAASGWKAFAPMFGADSIFELDYFTTMTSESYLWSYGCGGGSYTSCNGIGNTDDFAADSLQSVFTMLFGSYFGDWDSQNNFLRAALASGNTLTNAWSGRPHWHFHQMALGANIGYSAQWAYNSNEYFTNYAEHWAHIGLMGDPTLRMHIIAPPSKLQATENNTFVDLTWQASSDNVLGYYLYRRENPTDSFARVTPEIVTTTAFTDSNFTSAGTYYYMVRAINLEETPSGSYYNLSQGDCDSIVTVATGTDEIANNFSFSVFPNPNKGVFTIEVKEKQFDNKQVAIFDIYGKKVLQTLLTRNRTEVDLSEIANGVYFVQVVGNDKSKLTQKIIKQ